MAPTKYQYTISTDFPNGKVNITQLQQTITYSSGIAIALDAANGINANAPDIDKCDIWFVDPLPAPDLAILDAVVASHPGIGVVATLPGSMPIKQQTITEDLTWQELESIITTPTFFLDGDAALLPQLIARVIGQFKTTALGGEVKVVEQIEGLPDVDIMPAVSLPDTADVWTTLKYDSSIPSPGWRPQSLLRTRASKWRRPMGYSVLVNLHDSGDSLLMAKKTKFKKGDKLRFRLRGFDFVGVMGEDGLLETPFAKNVKLKVPDLLLTKETP